MKVCGNCGEEFDGRDGDNECAVCEAASTERRAKARRARKDRDAVMRSMGLVKVRGAMGGTYWE